VERGVESRDEQLQPVAEQHVILRLAQRRLALPLPPRSEHTPAAALAGRRLPGPVRGARAPLPAPHIEVDHPGELVGIDCFYVGRLRGTHGAVWQVTAIDVYSSFAWAELVVCRRGNPAAKQTSKLAQRLARELKHAGGRLERVLADNGNEFRGRDFHTTIGRLKASVTHIHAGKPQTNGHVEALHKTMLQECWRPAFARYLYPRSTGLRRELDATSPTTTTTAPTTTASPKNASPRCPRDGDEMSRTCRHISEAVHLRQRCHGPMPSAFVSAHLRPFRRGS
jgi:transposase InsO family protein